jgi:hypothetical protein
MIVLGDAGSSSEDESDASQAQGTAIFSKATTSLSCTPTYGSGGGTGKPSSHGSCGGTANLSSQDRTLNNITRTPPKDRDT